MNPELLNLIDQLKMIHKTACQLQSTDYVRYMIDCYFDKISWSLLKEEWLYMKESEKDSFTTTMFNKINEDD